MTFWTTDTLWRPKYTFVKVSYTKVSRMQSALCPTNKCWGWKCCLAWIPRRVGCATLSICRAPSLPRNSYSTSSTLSAHHLSSSNIMFPIKPSTNSNSFDWFRNVLLIMPFLILDIFQHPHTHQINTRYNEMFIGLFSLLCTCLRI